VLLSCLFGGVLGLEEMGNSEIRYLAMPLFVKENVFGLQIPVDDVVKV
tara:strand:+ start:167 stop:310 length:144 start_codon:yes stop_codon:yes gene_type:complete